MFRFDFGVRQGSVLSACIFALYLDNLSGLCLSGCAIIFYADDIFFISPSICQLEKHLHIFVKKKQLHWLDTANFPGASKSWHRRSECRSNLALSLDVSCD